MEPIDLQAIQTENVTKQICEGCSSRHAKLCPELELNVESAAKSIILQKYVVQE